MDKMSANNFDEIFQQLDSENNGYISVEKFHNLLSSFVDTSNGNNHHVVEFDSEKFISSIMELLDPQKDGKIYLDDFKFGVKKLLETTQTDTNDLANLPEVLKGSQETLVNLAQTPAEELDTSEFPSAFVEHSTSGEGDSGVHSVSNDDALAALSQLDKVVAHQEDGDSLDLEPESGNWNQGGDESYEDYGGVESSILIDLSTPPPEQLAANGRPPPHPDSSNHLNPSLERGSEVRGTWPRRRSSLIRPPSASQLAREMYNASSSGRASPITRTSGDGMYFDDMETESSRELQLAYQEDMSEQLRTLTDKMEQLTHSHAQSDSKHHRLREENQILLDRIRRMEEEYRDAENKSRDDREIEKRRAKEKLTKLSKEKNMEIEALLDKLKQFQSIEHRLRIMESTSAEHRLEAARYKSESERLKLESTKHEERLELAESRLQTVKEENERYREVTKKELETVKRERDHCQQLLEELNTEVESLRGGGGASSGRERTTSAVELLSRYREVEQIAKRLTAENKVLREQLEEIQAELLTRGLEEGQALLRRHHGASNGASLASELEVMTKDESNNDEVDGVCEEYTMSYEQLSRHPKFDPIWETMHSVELMDLLVKEKDANEKLRTYVDRILLKIMEKQPDLLEVAMA